MLRELNQSACSKFRTFEKVLPREQGLSEGQIFTGTLFRSWFLRWKHTEYQPKVPSSWGKFLRWKRGYSNADLVLKKYFLIFWSKQCYIFSKTVR